MGEGFQLAVNRYLCCIKNLNEKKKKRHRPRTNTPQDYHLVSNWTGHSFIKLKHFKCIPEIIFVTHTHTHTHTHTCVCVCVCVWFIQLVKGIFKKAKLTYFQNSFPLMKTLHCLELVYFKIILILHPSKENVSGTAISKGCADSLL